MSNTKFYDIIRSPIVTEKSTSLSEQNKFVFRVPLDANKQEIKQAVETLFKVKVLSVNTLKTLGKTKRFKGMVGKRSDSKKAIVTLNEGESMDVMAGAK